MIRHAQASLGFNTGNRAGSEVLRQPALEMRLVELKGLGIAAGHAQEIACVRDTVAPESCPRGGKFLRLPHQSSLDGATFAHATMSFET